MGDDFTMADCAAAPPLFYIDKVFPLGGTPQERGAPISTGSWSARHMRGPSKRRSPISRCFRSDRRLEADEASCPCMKIFAVQSAPC